MVKNEPLDEQGELPPVDLDSFRAARAKQVHQAESNDYGANRFEAITDKDGRVAFKPKLQRLSFEDLLLFEKIKRAEAEQRSRRALKQANGPSVAELFARAKPATKPTATPSPSWKWEWLKRHFSTPAKGVWK